jgi:glycosyltransferase involved in cell wall biosynthesis
VAAFPPLEAHGNPYQRLLYEHLVEHGVVLVSDVRLRLSSLARWRGEADVLHFHWPESYFLHRRGPRWVRIAASSAKLAAFWFHLRAARALGYGIVWTVHQVRPHEGVWPPLERRAVRSLARMSSGLIAHDRSTADRARAELGDAAPRIEVIPHGSYVGVYPPGRPRAVVRQELGITPGSFVFIAFGQIRRYKDTELLLEAFSGVDDRHAVLVVAGETKDPASAAAVREAAAADGRVVPVLRFVPDQQVAELFGAADAAVCARRDGGTSGSVVLALSLGVPVVAADAPGYRDVIGDDGAGWYFDPARRESLKDVLESVAADAGAAGRARDAASRRAGVLDWDDVAKRTASILVGARRRAHGPCS